jgi:hypothetical protein
MIAMLMVMSSMDLLHDYLGYGWDASGWDGSGLDHLGLVSMVHGMQ